MSSNPNRDPETLRRTLLTLVNEELPRLHGRTPQDWPPVSSDTQLFETGRLDSLSILHLIGAIEDHTGQPVPDWLVSMKYFQSIETITQTFGHEPTHSNA
ncbi:hypothetical protein FEM03_01260 [Phragmitibacter flavus]|uniref:Carrier domain-containing protein n=1 Tax=Phragmitibacter flavus TaxID=2576071 RepID=A0A5R8KKI4_9BACT|nr:phosphopantetheine-binding protein [Phragmitibacter flavus]TLD72731.1 hypothetical protein FEM03_01260 [Phragmitibacter flavus]